MRIMRNQQNTTNNQSRSDWFPLGNALIKGRVSLRETRFRDFDRASIESGTMPNRWDSATEKWDFDPVKWVLPIDKWDFANNKWDGDQLENVPQAGEQIGQQLADRLDGLVKAISSGVSLAPRATKHTRGRFFYARRGATGTPRNPRRLQLLLEKGAIRRVEV